MLRNFSLLLLTSCGFTLTHRGIPSTVNANIGPDFEKAAKFCDDRYGEKSDEAESCFQDYRDYTKIRVVLDMQAIEDFCNKNYTDDTEKTKCISDVAQIFDSILSEGK
jgi:hypothetical protein